MLFRVYPAESSRYPVIRLAGRRENGDESSSLMTSAKQIAQALGNGKEKSQGHGTWVTICPSHSDVEPSMSVSDGPSGKVLVKCHAGCSQTEVIGALRAKGLWAKPSGAQNWKALKRIPEGKSPPKGFSHYKLGVPSRWWVYKDFDGNRVGYVARFDKPDGSKNLLPLSWCQEEDTGDRKFVWKSFARPRPLYGEHLLKGSSKPIMVVEGEKACDAARELFPDHDCLSWPGGTGAVKLANWQVLKGKDVTIWPDADEPGLKAASSIGEILADAKASSVKTVFPPDSLPKGWDLADEPEGSFDPKKALQEAKAFAPSGDAKIDEMNRKYALALLGDKAAVIWEKWDPGKGRTVPVFLSKQAVKDHLANQFVPVGMKEVPVFDVWLSHPARKTYDGVVFEPGLETPRDFNLWRGFTFVPDPTGDWSMFRDHVMKNAAHGDESKFQWIMCWFAQMVQKPREKPGTSITFQGKQGTGKTIIGQAIGHLMRDNYVLVDSSQQVTGNFNAHMSHALLFQADEGFFGGDPRISGRLKSIVTSETNRIEYKGKDSFEIRNYMRFLVTSNERWVVPAAFEERRFAVFNVTEGRIQDREYFEAMFRQLRSGGYEGLLHDLMHWDLTKADVGSIPATAALAEQKEQSLDTVQRFWMERLESREITQSKFEWPRHVGTEELYDAYVRRCMQWGVSRRQSSRQFAIELQELVPGGLEVERAVIKTMDERGFSREGLRWCYVLPTAEACRSRFEKVIGHSVEWPTEGSKAEPELDSEIPF